jgi:hypothetical protein
MAQTLCGSEWLGRAIAPAVFTECTGWPGFRLLDAFDALDAEEAGEVPARLCHAVLCLWLAKECGRCAHFWQAFHPGPHHSSVWLRSAHGNGAHTPFFCHPVSFFLKVTYIPKCILADCY